MRWFLAPTLALLAAGLAHAQATVEGQVLDAVTSAPVRKASVSLFCGRSEREVEPDAAGRFAFQAVPAGSCTIVAKAIGHIADSAEIKLVDGQKLNGIALRLAP